MTQLARIIITLGTALFTAGTLVWIIKGEWQWFAGGAALFFGSILAGGILSVEVKQPQRQEKSYPTPTPSPPPSPHEERATGIRFEQKPQPDDPFSS